MIDAAALRKINLLSAKERPECTYCKTLVGFTWYESDAAELSLCQKCMREDNIPAEVDRTLFVEKSVSKEFWGKLEQQVEAQSDQQVAKPAKLNSEGQ